MSNWKDVAGEHYSEHEENYIHSFNFKGGGAYSINKNGIYQISYIAREKKIKILIVNVMLFFMYFKRVLLKSNCM